jgi:hypothetical protein
VQAGTTLVVVEVEPWVLPAGAGVEVGEELMLVLMLLLARRVSGAMMLHRPVPQGSTTGHSCYNLPLLCLLEGMNRIIRDDDIADKF